MLSGKNMINDYQEENDDNGIRGHPINPFASGHNLTTHCGKRLCEVKIDKEMSRPQLCISSATKKKTMHIYIYIKILYTYGIYYIIICIAFYVQIITYISYHHKHNHIISYMCVYTIHTRIYQHISFILLYTHTYH